MEDRRRKEMGTLLLDYQQMMIVMDGRFERSAPLIGKTSCKIGIL